LLDVVAEYFEELGYLAIQSRKMRFSPEFGPAALRRLDTRAAAQVAAIQTAGAAGIEVAKSRLTDGDPFQQFVAIRTWIELGRPSSERVLARLAAARGPDLPAWREALRHASSDPAHWTPPLAASEELGDAFAVVVDAHAWHGLLTPRDARSLARSTAPAVRAAVARSLSRAPREADDVMHELCGDADPEVARRARWSAALRDPRAAADHCRRALDAGSADAFTVQTLGLLGDAADHARLAALAASGSWRPAALRALGHLGVVDAIAPILDTLSSDDAELALAASDALESLVGLVPRRDAPAEGLGAARPQPIDPERGRLAWAERAPALDASRRWARGRPFTIALEDGAYPMESLWRAAVADPASDERVLRVEVPDGFFAASPTVEATVGE
jgi:HEAT repeat protein